MPILVYKEDINKYTPIVIREDGEGDNPTLWFPMPASIGLYYSMEIVMKDSLISSAKINQDNSWFCIFDSGILKNIHTNHEYNLDHVESHDAIVTTFDDKPIDENDPIDSIDKIVTTEVNYGTGSKSIFIIFQGSLEGEYKEDIHITATDGKHYTIPVGIEVYSQDESLDINLKNMGVELPYSIDSALYDKNILEENHDWVLINQKWKELLVSYMDIIGNKGSYKSLENSLKWFGYDKLAEMRELWQYKTPSGRNLLMDRTIEPILLGVSRSMLQEARKTTSFLLRNKVSDTIYTGAPSTINGTNVEDMVDFDESDFNDCRWDIGTMMTKMTLLGLFIDKYFFPVSAEVWKSTVEHIIYGTIEIETDSLHTTSIVSNNAAQDIPKDEINIPTTDPDDPDNPNKGDSDDPDHPDNPDNPSIDPGDYVIGVDDRGSTCDINMHLGFIDCIAVDPKHPNDPTGSFTTKANEYEKTDGDTAMIGILPKTDVGTDEASIYASLRSFYRGLGGAIRIKITQTDEDKKDNKPFYDKAGLRYVYPTDKDKDPVVVERSMKISPDAHSIDIYLFFDHIGMNVAMLTLYKGNNVYTKRFNVNVVDNINLELRYFKFVRRANTTNPFLPTSLPAYNKYMFSRIYHEDPVGTKYDPNDTSWVNKIHLPITSEILSQLIIIKCDNKDFDNVYSIIIKDNWLTQTFYVPSDTIYNKDWDDASGSPQPILSIDNPRNFFGVHKIYKTNTTKSPKVDKVIRYDENQPYKWGIYIVPKILPPRDKKAEYDKYCLARIKQILKDAQVKVTVTAKQAFIPELCAIQRIGLDYDNKFIRSDDLIMIVPVMSYTSDKTIFLPYSSNVDNKVPWSVKSVYGIDDLITLGQPTQTALIGSSHKKPLAPGWYDVSFEYAVCGKEDILVDKGAFCIKS